MKPMKLFPVVALVFAGLALHAAEEEAKPVKAPKASAHASATAPPADSRSIVFQGDTKLVPRLIRRSEGSYEMVYDQRMVMPLWTSERFQTSITLPKGEQVWKANASDDDDWEVTWPKKSNLVFVKPLFPNSSTSVHVVTLAGNHYTFRATSGVANGGNEVMLLLDVLPPAWMKAELARQETSRKPGATRANSGPIAGPGDSPNGEDDLVPASEVDKARRTAYEAGMKVGTDQAMAKRDDELREYAYSLFHNANENYKWSGDTKELRIKRVFDDGRVTYIIFESALNTMPAFWLVEGGERKDIRAQRPTFASDVIIVSRLFKEGTLSLSHEVEVKVSNKGWVLPPIKAQARPEGSATASKGVAQ